MEFDRLGVFTYSDEDNTTAYDLTGKVYELALERGATLVSSREIVLRAVRMDGKSKSNRAPAAVAGRD